MPLRLPDSPIRSIKRCFKCNNLSVEFWNPKHNRSYTVEEWLTICEDGKEALRKILKPIVEDPKWFFDQSLPILSSIILPNTNTINPMKTRAKSISPSKMLVSISDL